jgi:uncharacterized protein
MSIAQQLYHLQEIDIGIEADRHSLDVMKGQLGESASMQKARAELAAEQKLIADLKKQQQSVEWETDDITLKLKKAEEELYSGRIRNPKELSSLQQDVSMLKSKRGKLDDVDLELMDKLEISNTRVSKLNEEFKKMESQWQVEQHNLKSEIGKTTTRLSNLEQERQVVCGGVSKDILNLYEELKKKRKTAVAKAMQGTCSGCHIQLSVTDLQKVRSGNLVQCSSCGRILYLA